MICLAEIIGDKEGMEMIKQTWKIQGKHNHHFFMKRALEIFETADKEIRSYLIFIIDQMIKNKILTYEGEEIENEITGFFRDFLPMIINLKDLLIKMMEFSNNYEDYKIIGKNLYKIRGNIYYEDDVLQILRVVNKKIESLLKLNHFYENTRKFFRYLFFLTYESFIQINEYDLEMGMMSFTGLVLRKCLVKFNIFLFLNGFTEKEEFKDLLVFVFQALQIKSYDIKKADFLYYLNRVNPYKFNLIKRFHLLVQKFRPKVIFY